MGFGRLHRGLFLASALCGVMLSHGELHALGFPEFLDPNPVTGNQFGATVVVLSTGNVVITSPFDDFGGTDAGAVYLFNGATGALISTLRGSSTNDLVGGGGVVALANGNFVVKSPDWNLGAGAVTWGSGAIGVSGTVSPANSLVGSTASDFVGGGLSGVTALPNGNYVVASSSWNNGAAVDAGAVTWGSGTMGVSGVLSPANSLVGSTANDFVGQSVTVLSSGNYLVRSTNWDNGAAVDAGAVTWVSATTGMSGPISAANSLVGSAADDNVGNVTLLSTGNYVVSSPFWDNGATADAGAATWASGTTGITGTISAANSLVGSLTGSNVGNGVIALTNGNYVVGSPFWDGAIGNGGAVTWANGTTGVTGLISAANSLIGSVLNDRVGDIVVALPNGNYVVASPNWDNGATLNAGAVTWGSGTTGVIGAVSAANSLVGSRPSDQVGSAGVKALTNGNYVVVSTVCDNGVIGNAGAVTWGSGTTGVIGTVSAANSLVGSTSNDQVGSGGVTALTNGNYVVRTNGWNNGGVSSAGAVTWGSGTTGVSGVVSAANSLVGSTAGDVVGTNGVVALTNGSYVVVSTTCDNGAIVDAGAVTWGSGSAGVSGPVSAANSLVGATANDQVGNQGVTALSNGNYVVRSTNWDNGAVVNAGAATWGSGTTGVSGTISGFNSLVGSSANDNVGGGGVTALANGNYVVTSPNRDNGAITNVGAATWGNGTTGVSGTISAANSLVGSTAVDQVGNVAALSNGDYVVLTVAWDNGALASAGAATWGSGTVGIIGAVSSANSLIGTAANTGLQLGVVEDVVNGTFFARFLTEGGGRVRVRVIDPSPVIVSATDIPNDQGGWLRLTFNRSALDDAIATPPVATYGVWRLLPSSLPARASKPSASGALDQRFGYHGVELQQSLLAAGLDMRESEGQLYLTSPGSAAIAATFPPGQWALVTNVPALQQAQYLVDVPAISNTAPNTYVVTAHTTVPSIWYISNTVSGQSVDNLAPSQPTGLTAAYSSGQTQVQWAANTESDLGAYHLHRGASADFIPSSGNLIASQIALSYADVGPAGGFYKLSAKDVNGNESTFALLTPQQTTGVGEGAPVAFALHGAHPNPAEGNRLHVAFALPSGAPARLELHDVGGRRVRAREVGSLGVGQHTVNLAEGRRVAAGIYWVSLSQGGNQQRARVAVIR